MFQVWFKNRRAKDRKQKRETGKGKVSDKSECDLSDDEERAAKQSKEGAAKQDKSPKRTKTEDVKPQLA